MPGTVRVRIPSAMDMHNTHDYRCRLSPDRHAVVPQLVEGAVSDTVNVQVRILPAVLLITHPLGAIGRRGGLKSRCPQGHCRFDSGRGYLGHRTPTGRGGRLKPGQVLVRIQPVVFETGLEERDSFWLLSGLIHSCRVSAVASRRAVFGRRCRPRILRFPSARLWVRIPPGALFHAPVAQRQSALKTRSRLFPVQFSFYPLAKMKGGPPCVSM